MATPALNYCQKQCATLCYEEPLSDLSQISECLYRKCKLDLQVNSSVGAFLDLLASSQNLSQVEEVPVNVTCPDFENAPFKLDSSEYVVPLFGYLSPILIFLTIINNILVCIVLLKPHMRSPTNAILVAMAMCDMLTGLFPLPVYIHFYSTGRYLDYVPYKWCLAVKVLLEHLPTIFHTTSIWLTMGLGVQRYIYVCHSFRARTWCTIQNVVTATLAIFLLATLSHLSRFFDRSLQEVQIRSTRNDDQMVSACLEPFRDWLRHSDNTRAMYFGVYYWYRAVFMHLIPCVSLMVVNALLIYAMKKAQQRRMQLLRQNKKSESRKLKQSNCTTLMLVSVVGLFLLVEFPLGVVIVLVLLSNNSGIVVLSEEQVQVASNFANFFILLSYPFNFFIYCGMSKQFRETFKRLFTGGTVPLEREYSHYMTLPTENGKSTAVTGDETAL